MSEEVECDSCFQRGKPHTGNWHSEQSDGATKWYCPVCCSKAEDDRSTHDSPAATFPADARIQSNFVRNTLILATTFSFVVTAIYGAIVGAFLGDALLGLCGGLGAALMFAALCGFVMPGMTYRNRYPEHWWSVTAHALVRAVLIAFLGVLAHPMATKGQSYGAAFLLSFVFVAASAGFGALQWIVGNWLTSLGSRRR